MSFLPRARRRIVGACLAALVCIPVLAALSATAHEGHDHGPALVQLPVLAEPRIALQTDLYELVGILRGNELVLYLDLFETNAPVEAATIEVMIGVESVVAEASGDVYRARSPALQGSGPLELVFSVASSAGDDLLIGTLARPVLTPPQPAAAAPPTFSGFAAALLAGEMPRAIPMDALAFAGVGLLGFLLGLLARGAGRGRRMAPIATAATAAALALVVLAPTASRAHEGHDHGTPPSQAVLGTGPSRLPGGAVFLPKPSQRLLGIRTQKTAVDEAERAVTLIGRVVPDPNRSGLVQSNNGGRILAPEGGLPLLGHRVRKGDLLALVEPPLGRADRAGLSERLAEIEQEIAVAEARLERARQLAERAAAPASQITDAQTELAGLRARREVISAGSAEPEELRAPIDGVISGARVVLGQVVQAQDVLFQIVDPDALWVEALVFGEIDPEAISGASARTNDGIELALAFQGYGRTLQQQATLVQFAIAVPGQRVKVGQPLSVIARDGMTTRGIVLPREAVVRGPSGDAVVWLHREPERFEARPVRVEPFDAGRLVAVAGLEPDERVVVRGAELINQVR